MTKRNKLSAIITGITLIVSIIALYTFFDYKSTITEPASGNEDLIELTIAEGESTRNIAENLSRIGLIKSTLYFEIYVRVNNLATELQAGNYRIPANVTMEELAEILQVAYEQDVWITLPEGLMAIEVTDVISTEFAEVENSLFIRSDFLDLIESTQPVIDAELPIPDGKTCEGYLFPDTYRFSPDSTADSVLNELISNFKTKIYDKYSEQIYNSEYSLYQVIILASILEKETYHSEDRPLVADILEKRLEIGCALEVDATLLYHFQDWEYDILTEDLQLDTLYNTRKYSGFTPTPISNPGEETISAILNPEASEYWFYISDDDGNLYYGETLDEHNQNIQQYLSP
jgi:UPF0755 protein